MHDSVSFVPLSSLSVSFLVVFFFCLLQTVWPGGPGWKTPLHKHLSQIRSPAGNRADSVSWCFSDPARTREPLSKSTEGRNSYGWLCENAATAALSSFSWSKEKNSYLHIIHWNLYLHLSPSECIVQVSRWVSVFSANIYLLINDHTW